MHKIPFTKTGYEELKRKLEEEIEKRPNAVATLKRAREMGDLSENGLYKAARFELSNIDRQIRFFKNLIKYGIESVPTNSLTVQLGHKIKIQGLHGQKDYQIVGEYEADPRVGKISYKSPIGHNLMGRKINELVKISTPNGVIEYTINKIF